MSVGRRSLDGIVAVSTSRWRWLFLLHVALTMMVVSATGNHWWLDGIVAIVLLAVALAIDRGARRVAASGEMGVVTLPVIDDSLEPSVVANSLSSAALGGGLHLVVGLAALHRLREMRLGVPTGDRRARRSSSAATTAP